MDFWEKLGEVAANVSNTISSSLGKINNSSDDKNSKDIDSNQNVSSIEPNYLSAFPKIELAVRKEIDNNITENNRKIDYLMSKYISKSFSEKLKVMSDIDKAKIYCSLGEKLGKTGVRSLDTIKTNDIAISFLKHALDLNPKDINIAYKLFDIIFDSESSISEKEGANIAQICLKLSRYKDTEKKFAKIYTYLGKYYYHIEEDYETSLRYYLKVQEYCDKEDSLFQNSLRFIGILYYQLGEYKKALDAFNQLKNVKEGWPNVYDVYTKVKNYVALNISKSQETDRLAKKNMYYEFRDCVGKYPDETLVEAYKHFLKAKELIKEQRRLEAVEEYKIVKQILPETARWLNPEISMLIQFNVTEDNKDYYYKELFKTLKERMDYALKTNNRRSLCGVLNEMASVYGDLNDYEKKIDCLKKAIDIAGIVSLYGLNLANTYKNIGLFDDAINIYKEILEKDSNFSKQNNLNLEYEISNLIDIKHGRKGKNGENYILAYEHAQNGDRYFNSVEYEKAFLEYNAAFEGNKTELDYIIKKLMVKEIYEYNYSDEKEICIEALFASEKNDKIEYLPFLLTLYGDSITYESWGNSKIAEICYELAVDLLNKVPSNEKFAAPYYKLARLKEQEKKYEEALVLYQFANTIDKSYNTEKDIIRIQSIYKDGGIQNTKEAELLIKDMNSNFKASTYFKVIQIGKEALNLAPNNIEIYYMLCKAAEFNKKYYILKWAAREGLRLHVSNFGESSHFDYFIWCLAKCCKYEYKLKEAAYYYNIIIDGDEFRENELTHDAIRELDSLRLSEDEF